MAAGIMLVDYSPKKNRRLGGERILGGSDFVEAALKAYDKTLEKNALLETNESKLKELIDEICTECSICRENLIYRGRSSAVSNARAIISFKGISNLDMSTVDLAEILSISHQAVSKAANTHRSIRPQVARLQASLVTLRQ